MRWKMKWPTILEQKWPAWYLSLIEWGIVIAVWVLLCALCCKSRNLLGPSWVDFCRFQTVLVDCVTLISIFRFRNLLIYWRWMVLLVRGVLEPVERHSVLSFVFWCWCCSLNKVVSCELCRRHKFSLTWASHCSKGIISTSGWKCWLMYLIIRSGL